MFKHSGPLYLSRKQKPVATRAADGTFALTLLAFDRYGPLQVESYQITWSGPKALAFWGLHGTELTPGAVLQVELVRLRLHITTGRYTVAQILADVKSLQVTSKASNTNEKASACAA